MPLTTTLLGQSSTIHARSSKFTVEVEHRVHQFGHRAVPTVEARKAQGLRGRKSIHQPAGDTQSTLDGRPGNIAIVGYDDIGFAGAAAVPLSSVRQPRELLGRTAAELLLAESKDLDGHVHQQVVFHPELVVRTSSISRGDHASVM